MKTKLILIALGLSSAFQPSYAENTPNIQKVENQCAILLHGLVRSSRSMHLIEKDLIERDYYVVNEDYPSTSASIKDLANETIPDRIQKCPEEYDINFVTHSLGGILVRSFYAENPNVELPRAVVMLGPPNQGSEIIDHPVYDFTGALINGEAGEGLSTDAAAYVNQLGAVDFQLGIIAGNSSYNPLYSSVLPGADDGKVSVHRTWVAGATDWIELPVSHTFIMRDETVRQQIVYFLRYGEFFK